MKTVRLGGLKAAGRVALVDDADYDLVMAYSWHIQPTRRWDCFYALTNVWRDGCRTSLKMNTLITNWQLSDHINGDGLDNQRSNLRLATSSQNAMNRKLQGGTSRFKGVGTIPDSPKWRAYIKVDGRRRHLGMFANEIDAALAYDAAAREAFGPYARLNFPEAA